MKTIHKPILMLALSLLGIGTGAVASRAQVILNPELLGVTAQFNNANVVILSLLDTPGNEGMSNFTAYGSSLPPAAGREATAYQSQADSRTSTTYPLTVDADIPGVEYSVYAVVTLLNGRESYYFNAITSAPVVIGMPPPPVTLSECVGIVTIEFVDPEGTPVTVDGGQAIVYDAETFGYTAVLDFNGAPATQQHLYLRGGRNHLLNITARRGSDHYTDRIDTLLSTNVAVMCDAFTTLQMVIPGASSLGRIVGNVDMLGEFELAVPGLPGQPIQYPDYSTVVANYGPFGSARWGRLGGANFSMPSSGTFTLSNVMPSTLDPLCPGYMLYAQMAIRTNRMIELFLTPAMNSGLNPPVVVGEGATVDLGNLLVIDPGYLRGRVLLQGPAEGLGRASLLRGLLHAGDDDADQDGVPDYLGTYGVYWSSVEAVGVDRLASEATLTASGGVAVGDFAGAFNPATSAYEGQYELALGGLNGERSIWKQKYFSLTLESGVVTNENDYFYNTFYILDNTTNDVEVVPGQPVTNDVSFCLSEVKVVFRSTSGTFYNPMIRPSTGAFTGTNFLGQPADYSVNLQSISGAPTSPSTATNIGQVVMYLPQGTYTLSPAVSLVSGTYDMAGLAPINITVGCGQRIAIEPCLQVSLDAPGCSTSRQVRVSGSVRSCGNSVASISYRLNDGAEQMICSGCGADPAFAFEIALADECTENTLTVTATDSDGGVSSVTTTLHYDATPPLIQCPGDLTVTACDTNGAVVNFSVAATDDCPGPVIVECVPPSGSVFPIGTTTVNCTATDSCGNRTNCSFNVTVGGAELSIESAVIVRWCGQGTLQGAADVNGPYTDIPGATSPYASPASDPRKFFRVRQ